MNTSPRTPRRLRSAALLVAGTVGVGALLYAMPTEGSAATGLQRSGTRAEIRVDQVGYAVGETKKAFVMGSQAALQEAGFKLVDRDGKVVATGKVGARTGNWNSTYDAVHVLDLSAVNTPGSYHLELTGSAAGTSPTFKIASARDLMTPWSRTTCASSRLSATAPTCSPTSWGASPPT